MEETKQHIITPTGDPDTELMARVIWPLERMEITILQIAMQTFVIYLCLKRLKIKIKSNR
jgi:hypothetical protein